MTKLYAGLDVSLEMTSVCVVDDDGHICLKADNLAAPSADGGAGPVERVDHRRQRDKSSAIQPWTSA